MNSHIVNIVSSIRRHIKPYILTVGLVEDFFFWKQNLLILHHQMLNQKEEMNSHIFETVPSIRRHIKPYFLTVG